MPGGEEQGVLFDGAVLNTPPLLLADEPTGNLDDANGAVIFDALRSRARAGAAVVVVSHRPEAATGATAVYRLRGGVLEARADPWLRRFTNEDQRVRAARARGAWPTGRR